MKNLVFGKDGQLGRAFQLALGDSDSIFIGRQECDLSNSRAILECLREINPDCIINAAAYTAVDKAEEEKEVAFAVNALALKAIAEYCAAHQKKLIHFSSDYVFDGMKSSPYVESDLCMPLSVYGKSKYAGELAIIEAFASQPMPLGKASSYYSILRTSWVYGDGANFIRTVLRLAKERSSLNIVADQFGVPTSTDWLAKLTIDVLQESQWVSGVYHAVPAGRTSWYELARFVVEYAQSLGVQFALDVGQILPIPASDYPLPAKRPMNSQLSTRKLADALPSYQNLLAQDWKISVESYLLNLKSQGLL
ncbi:dTDP-4-dehydrorhamnose reductase [Polynucleobacter acidiphobus]|uniref:dTDP-4-dehydrorhamnose reductase n=1 Tax=Polynucleobacter acidiphobus TaxID=556053 RepID=UPI000D336091|nr:dTDP-4-dehydrorhamnose reductase [Polynucleobacter acidiphobus]